MDPERSKLPILLILARGVLVAEGPLAGMGATDSTAAETIVGSADGTPVANGREDVGVMPGIMAAPVITSYSHSYGYLGI